MTMRMVIPVAITSHGIALFEIQTIPRRKSAIRNRPITGTRIATAPPPINSPVFLRRDPDTREVYTRMSMSLLQS